MYKSFIKRILDILFSLLIIPIFCLIFVVVAPIIYFTDKGPIFYCGERLGKNGIPYRMYKFRTMRVNAPDLRNEDGTTFNAESDPRVTSIGRILRKTSIDEVPQILNVLKGEMSLIGPRPDLPDAVKIYRDNERRKLEILPGITGYSQAYYRNSIEIHERFEQDIYYVDNVSFLLDVKVFFKTISTVLFRKGIYRNKDKM